MGLWLCLIANVVAASEKASFSLPEIGHGIPPLGVFPYLAAAVGVRKAVGFAMSGHRIDVSKALEWGIVDYKVSDQDSNGILTSLA
jgi:enoyl-CoA hydratase/carnithine racemase